MTYSLVIFQYRMCVNIKHFNGMTLDNELQESRVTSRQWSCQTGSERVKFAIAGIIGNSFFRFLKFVFKDETVAPHYMIPFTCSYATVHICSHAILHICSHATLHKCSHAALHVLTCHSTCVDMPLYMC